MDDKDREPEKSGNGAVWGVLFVVLLAAGAIYLIDRMRNAAELADCAFTHAPKCRELMGK